MHEYQRRILGLCLPPVVLTCLDCFLTLHGQSAAYWAGNHSRVDESSPILRQLLAHNPAAFIAGMAGWIFVYCLLILVLPRTLALMTSITVAIGHTWGASTWLFMLYGYNGVNSLVFVTGFLLAMGISWGWRVEALRDESAGRRMPQFVRWGIIALIGAGMLGFAIWPPRL